MTVGHIKASELLRIGDRIRVLRKNKKWTQKSLLLKVEFTKYRFVDMKITIQFPEMNNCKSLQVFWV